MAYKRCWWRSNKNAKIPPERQGGFSGSLEEAARHQNHPIFSSFSPKCEKQRTAIAQAGCAACARRRRRLLRRRHRLRRRRHCHRLARPLVEARIEPCAEPLVEARIEPCVEPLVQPRIDPCIEPRWSSRRSSRASSRWSSRRSRRYVLLFGCVCRVTPPRVIHTALTTVLLFLP